MILKAQKGNIWGCRVKSLFPVAIFRQYFRFRITPHQASQIRAQSSRDEAPGRPSKLVDENLSVLRERLEKVKGKEKLQICYRREYGWNYASGYNYKLKREA